MSLRLIFALVLSLSFVKAFSQSDDKVKISISFENSSIKEVLHKIEDITDYKFYYLDEWFKEELVSGNYENVAVEQVLKDILNSTLLNFYILDANSIILTLNNLIYGELPIGFFEKKSELETENEEGISPIFYDVDDSKSTTTIETVRIGKENKNINQQEFTLTGQIRSNTTNDPIPNIAIVVKGSNQGTETDLNGFYKIKLSPGLNVLEISSIAVDNVQKRIFIYNNGRYDFKLNESYGVLDEIVVSADSDKNIAKAITGVSQIEIKQIKNIPLLLGVRDMLKVATILPGISTAGEGSGGYNVRGGKTDQNLILLDNAVIYNPSHFFGIFSALNPFTTGSVNIYKGSIPSEYGGRLSSVFEIDTKDANLTKFSGEASVGPVMSNLTLEVPIVKDKAGFLVGGRSTYSDWILKSLEEESLKNSQASFYDIIAKYNHKINENNDLKISGYTSKDLFSITSDSIYSYTNNLASLKWDHKFNDKSKASFIFANSQYKFDIDFDSDTKPDENFNLAYKINESEAKIKVKYQFSDTHQFDYGISSKLYVVNPGSFNPIGSNSIFQPTVIPKERALESALFISDSYTVNENLLVDIGFRYSFYTALGESVQRVYEEGLPLGEGTLINSINYKNNESIVTYNGLETRASFRYFLGSNFSLKASYNNTFQYIHTLSNNTTVSPTDTWKLSDLNIKPQRANQYSIGLYKNSADNNYELSLEGYYKRFENILDYKVGAKLLLSENIETQVLQGEGKAYGAEFLIKKLNGKFNGWFGYTYSRTMNKFDSNFNEELINGGDYFPSNYDKPHDLSLVVNYKLTNRFSVSTNFIYQTGRPVTYPVGNYTYNGNEFVLYSDRNRFRIPDYYRLDLSFNLEGNHKIKKFAHSFWNFSIYNVLGRNNPYSVFFVNEDGNIKSYKSSIFSIPVPTISYNFKF